MAIGDPAYAHLPEAVAAGLVDEKTLDASVRRVLTAKARMGLLDDPYVDEENARTVLADPAHRAAAAHGRAALGGPAPQRGRPAAPGEPAARSP